MTTYKGHNELVGKTLEKGDKIIFITPHGELKYTVKNDYLRHETGGYNHQVFRDLNIGNEAMREFLSEKYEYPCNSGEWPTYRNDDYEAATRAVLGVFKLLNQGVKVESWRAELQ